MTYDETVEQLVKKIESLDYVQDFQKAESALRAESSLFEAQEEMKKLQKEAVLYQKIGKMEAYKATSQAAQKIEKQLKQHPLVENYVSKLENVNDLIQHITGEIEQKVNALLESNK